MIRFSRLRPIGVPHQREPLLFTAHFFWLLLYVILIVFEGWLLWRSWASGPFFLPWFNFWGDGLFLVLAAIALVTIFGSIGRTRSHVSFFHVLFHKSDIELPLVDALIDPLSETETLEQSEHFGRLGPSRRLETESRWSAYYLRQLYLSQLPLYYLILFVNILPLPLAPYLVRYLKSWNVTSDSTIVGSLSGIGILCVSIFLILSLILNTGYFGSSVLATKQGLAIGKRVIAWQDIHGFYIYRVWNKAFDEPQPIYWRIETDHEIIAWYLNYANSTPTVQQCLRLGQIITASSMIPLHDLTPLVNRLQKQRGGIRVSESEAREARTLLSQIERPPTERKKHFLRVSLLFLPPLILGTLGSAAQIAQPTYLADLPNHVQARAPLFSDPLITHNGVWSINHSIYHLASTAATTIPVVLSNAVYANVAVAVTVTGKEGDNVALIVRSDPQAKSYLAFTFHWDADPQQDGIWDVAVCTGPQDRFCLRNSGDLQFTSTEFPSTQQKHLMIWMSGNVYRFFIDDRFVGSYIDAADELPTKGEIGFYHQYLDKEVTYTNFAVYPIDTTFPWSY